MPHRPSHHGQLRRAIGHLRRVYKGTCADIATFKLTEFYRVFMVTTLAGIASGRTSARDPVRHSAPSRPQTGMSGLLQQTVNALSVKFIDDNCRSGHLLLHVMRRNPARLIQIKPSAVWQRGFNSSDDTETARNFEVDLAHICRVYVFKRKEGKINNRRCR